MNDDIRSIAYRDDVERVLASGEELVPSSGFTASVMEAVRQEAAMPAPIPFPWKWALPGLLTCVGLLVFGAVKFSQTMLRAGASSAVSGGLPSFSSILPHEFANASVRLGVEWTGIALVVSIAAIWFSMRIAAGGE